MKKPRFTEDEILRVLNETHSWMTTNAIRNRIRGLGAVTAHWFSIKRVLEKLYRDGKIESIYTDQSMLWKIKESEALRL